MRKLDKIETRVHKERIENEYWIDTYGKIRKWKGTLSDAANYYSLHYAIAKKLYPKIENPDDYLHSMNWIAIGAAAYGVRIKGEPTQAQINTLCDLGYRGIRDSYGETYAF